METDVHVARETLSHGGQDMTDMGALAISPVTAMVVHEIKNPLGVIRGCAELLRLENPDMATDESLAGIIEAVERIASVMDTVLTLAHRPAHATDSVDLVTELPLVTNFLTMAQRPKPRVVLDIPDYMPQVAIAAGDLEQVLLNILANACDAQDGVPEVSIGAEVYPGGAPSPRWSKRIASTTPERMWEDIWPPDRGCVCVIISDTGCGIPEEVLAQLFQEQITTKGRGHGGGKSGTGLGMLLCRELLSIWGCSLVIESRPGKGTTSRVYLPFV